MQSLRVSLLALLLGAAAALRHRHTAPTPLAVRGGEGDDDALFGGDGEAADGAKSMQDMMAGMPGMPPGFGGGDPAERARGVEIDVWRDDPSL